MPVSSGIDIDPNKPWSLSKKPVETSEQRVMRAAWCRGRRSGDKEGRGRRWESGDAACSVCGRRSLDRCDEALIRSGSAGRPPFSRPGGEVDPAFEVPDDALELQFEPVAEEAHVSHAAVAEAAFPVAEDAFDPCPHAG